MMKPDPRKRVDHLTTSDGACSIHTGAVPFNARQIIPGTEVFRIRNPSTDKTIFEGRPDSKDRLVFRSMSDGKVVGGMEGRWSRHTGCWQIVTDPAPHLEDGEEITLTYMWQPHYLSGAKVLVHLNGEDQFVPIEDVQDALRHYLGRD